jgi:uncharacterized protein DUF2637
VSEGGLHQKAHGRSWRSSRWSMVVHDEHGRSGHPVVNPPWPCLVLPQSRRWRLTSMPTIWCGARGGRLDCSPGPLTVDGLIYASSMVMLDSARRKAPVPALARWLLGLGIAATLAANVAHGLGHGLAGPAVAAWPAVALVGSYELLMMVIRSSQVQPDATPRAGRDADPLQYWAAELFAGQLAPTRVPSVRAIRAQLHVGQPRAQRLRGYLATAARRVESSAA